jgi:hypothetical protein
MFLPCTDGPSIITCATVFGRFDIEFKIGLSMMDQASAVGGILRSTMLHLVLFVATS